jgi:hypothetical protein
MPLSDSGYCRSSCRAISDIEAWASFRLTSGFSLPSTVSHRAVLSLKIPRRAVASARTAFNGR